MEVINDHELFTLHAWRISLLIDIAKKGALTPVVFDTMTNGLDIYSVVFDSHHRIRALQYLKRPVFPAYCSGDVDEIDSITEIRKNY